MTTGMPDAREASQGHLGIEASGSRQLTSVVAKRSNGILAWTVGVRWQARRECLVLRRVLKVQSAF